jgi:hypothetical protein
MTQEVTTVRLGRGLDRRGLLGALVEQRLERLIAHEHVERSFFQDEPVPALAAHAPADVFLGFQNGNVDAGLQEMPGGDEPADAGSDHDDVTS